MARLMRMAGAFLLENQQGYFVIGNFKRPCNFSNYGFMEPERDTEAPKNPVLPLVRNDKDLSSDSEGILLLNNEDASRASRIANLFMISRNGSMSERLWDLVYVNAKEQGKKGERDASWLDHMPDEIWECVRDSVLRC